MNFPTFSPNGDKVPQGAMQVGIRPGPSLGHSQGQPQVLAGQPIPMPGQAPQQFQAQIGAPSLPKGAQPVALRQGFQLGGPQPPAPGFHQGFAPYPAAAPPGPGPALGDGGEEVHRIIVEGQTPDGKIWEAPYDAYFPRGTKILGVREVPSQG